MSRLFEEERAQLACLKTQGYSNFIIVQKYIWFVVIGIGLGSFFAYNTGLLLTPKAPKKWKKVLLEKIPFVWNRLSFKYKSTVRNVFLF